MSLRGLAAAILAITAIVLPSIVRSERTRRFDIAPFALPNCAPGEYGFEEPRDIETVVVRFRHRAPRTIGIRYLRKTWPQTRLESANAVDDPCGFGWMPIDDWFNGEWHGAIIDAQPEKSNTVVITFRGLAAEFPDAADYDVAFRRTLGLRIDVPDPQEIDWVRIHTASPQATSRLRVEFDAGRPTPARTARVTAYNATIARLTVFFIDDQSINNPQFTGPTGLGLKDEIGRNIMPIPMAHLGIGLPKGTDLKIRFIPNIKVGDDGELKMFGFGIMHDVKQYIPGIKNLPFDLSGFFGYSNINFKL